jgi:hypothetical protein
MQSILDKLADATSSPIPFFFYVPCSVALEGRTYILAEAEKSVN